MPEIATLDAVLSPRPVGPGRFVLDVPDGWQQGRGAFGGLVLGAAVRAIEAHAATPDRPLRTLTAELCGPVMPGPAEIIVEALRVGSGTSTIAARVVQGTDLQAHAVAVLGRHRTADAELVGVPAPAMPPWREVAAAPPMPNDAPPFASWFELRNVGPRPFSGSPPHAAGWVRPRHPGSRRDAAFVVACADAWWPAILAQLDGPRPAATITFTLDMVGGCDGLDADAPLFHDAHILATRAGYTTELRTLWGVDGRLVALNHQTLAIIR